MSTPQNRKTLRRRLAVDILLSTVGSTAAILTMRAVSLAIPGFIRLVTIWLAASVVFSIAGLLLSQSGEVVARYASLRGYFRLARALMIKEAGMALILLFGLIKLPSVALAFVALLADVIFTTATLFSPRLLVRAIRREEREIKAATGLPNALVDGTDDAAVALADEADASGHYNVLGYITDDPAQQGKVIGERIVYFASTKEEMDELQWRVGGFDCILFPKGRGGQGGPEGAADTVSANDDAMSKLGHIVKRGFDVTLSGLLMLVFSPLAALVALAVHHEDGGPAIYSQERLGRGGRPFDIYKFRSMRIDAEAAGSPALYSGDDDPRLTRVGKFIRQHHLDELPQLWNVFRGDMSFIGYRPERRFYIDQIMAINPRYRFLFQIRPGVTSYATLYNGYTDTLDKMLTRLDLDLYYLRNHSLWFDARLLALTFLRIVFGKKF